MGKPRKDQPLNQPFYKGGQDALKAFIKANLRYPDEAKREKIEGQVVAAYDVDDRGVVKQIRILESLGHGCDEEVVRLLNLLKYEKAFNNKRNVTIHRKIKVDFKLPAAVNLKNRQINYQLVAKNPKEDKKEQKTKSISYTLKY